MLRTVEFGTIRIVESVDPRFDTFCGWDLLGEWSFWVLPDGEVVALEEVEQTSFLLAAGAWSAPAAFYFTLQLPHFLILDPC